MLVLTIFGIVLFPHNEGYVDTTTISVFLTFRDKENPVSSGPAILADTYCRERKGSKISCCLLMLYVWFVSHTFVNKARAKNPIEDFKSCGVKTMNTQEWIQMLANLTEYRVRWYPSWWQERPKVIHQCISYQNVSLMGTMGFINYNLSLALRQFGYPMRNLPTKDMLIPFYLYGEDQKDVDMLRRTTQAWDRVVRKGRVLTKKSGDK